MSNKELYLIKDYSMKCRIYPNKGFAKKIDDAIKGIQTFANCTIWEMYNNALCTNVKQKRNKDGTYSEMEYIHFFNAKYTGSTDWKHKMIKEHPIIDCAPSSAITCKTGVITDLKKSFGKNPIEATYPPPFYTKKRPRRSYSYQESWGKILTKENTNVLYINLAKIGVVKVRGWNKNLRFGDNADLNFIEFVKTKKKADNITVTISKDSCNDYHIVFKLSNVFKPMNKLSGKTVGVDVGIKDIAILSDGTKFENRRYKKEKKKHLRALNRRLSRRQGWSNEKFRDAHKKDKDIMVSKRYENTKLARAKVERDIARKRNLYNNQITHRIINNYEFIGIESLNVKGMCRNRHLAYALSDAAIGDILQKLKYKGEWYKRIIAPINQWTPSSKRCSKCGHILPQLKLSVREWDCPECKEHHDRDINAAKNILYYALNQ